MKARSNVVFSDLDRGARPDFGRPYRVTLKGHVSRGVGDITGEVSGPVLNSVKIFTCNNKNDLRDPDTLECYRRVTSAQGFESKSFRLFIFR